MFPPLLQCKGPFMVLPDTVNFFGHIFNAHDECSHTWFSVRNDNIICVILDGNGDIVTAQYPEAEYGISRLYIIRFPVLIKDELLSDLVCRM